MKNTSSTINIENVNSHMIYKFFEKLLDYEINVTPSHPTNNKSVKKNYSLKYILSGNDSDLISMFLVLKNKYPFICLDDKFMSEENSENKLMDYFNVTKSEHTTSFIIKLDLTQIQSKILYMYNPIYTNIMFPYKGEEIIIPIERFYSETAVYK